MTIAGYKVDKVKLLESDLRKELEELEERQGMNGPATCLKRAQWAGVYVTMETLGIEFMEDDYD